ncbi:MAG: hypothetical protein M1827_006738 [Pycnora praestabilis]|nr:MAG: hypothetical protein M1827_006738 [Pycnora praestabilis]
MKRHKLNIEPTAARSRISRLKAQGANPATQTRNSQKNIEQQELSFAYENYETALRKANLLDYDDLLLRTVDLLRGHPTCVSNVEAVLIDEFQDTNVVQFNLMRLFAQRNKRITCVGDPDQSIYGFRSAETKNLKRMRTQYPDTLVILLEENYRSSGAILLSALEVIQQDESRPIKPLLPTHTVGTPPVLRKLPSAAIEASWIVSEVKRAIALSGNMITFGDIAILLRSASLSRSIESAFGKDAIPYVMVGGHKFFDRMEVKILLDYLRIISQPQNNDALARVVNTPSRRIGQATIKSLLEEAEIKGISLWNLILKAVQGHMTLSTKLSKSAEQGLGSFSNLIILARSRFYDGKEVDASLADLMEYVIKKLSYHEYLEKSHPEDHEGRWANVQELFAQASEFSDNCSDEDEGLPKIEGMEQRETSTVEDTLSRFLANVALSSEMKHEEDMDGTKGQVTISTIHAAKGLEWPVVFIPAVYEGSIPHSRAEDTDEERRLLYVAMTRAKVLLYLSCPMKNSQREQTTLSPFLNHKSVTPHLQNKGPSLGFSLVKSIARILRRSFPSETDIAKLCKGRHLADDLWSVNGEENNEAAEHGAWNDTTAPSEEQRAFKKCRVERDGHCLTSGGNVANMSRQNFRSTTTMQSAKDFSISSTAFHAGFVSAGSYLQDLSTSKCGSNPQSEDNMTAPSTSISNSAEIKENQQTDKKVKIQAKKRSDGQGTLMTFFSKATMGLPQDSSVHPSPNAIIPPKAMSATGKQSSTHKQDAASPEIFFENENGTANHTNKIAAASHNKIQIFHGKTERTSSSVAQASHRTSPPRNIPRSHENHRPRVTPLQGRPRPSLRQCDHMPKQYVFLSSSPPPLEHLSEEAEATKSSETLSKPAALVKHPIGVTASSYSNNIRPATTMHMTSMAQFQAIDKAPRRTLGVRRSINGWANRGTQPLGG